MHVSGTERLCVRKNDTAIIVIGGIGIKVKTGHGTQTENLTGAVVNIEFIALIIGAQDDIVQPVTVSDFKAAGGAGFEHGIADSADNCGGFGNKILHNNKLLFVFMIKV